jgi:leucyl-tRNA synthetase
MFLYDIGFIDFEEPVIKLIHQGMILNNGEKMSKSKEM